MTSILRFLIVISKKFFFYLTLIISTFPCGCSCLKEYSDILKGCHPVINNDNNNNDDDSLKKFLICLNTSLARN